MLPWLKDMSEIQRCALAASVPGTAASIPALAACLHFTGIGGGEDGFDRLILLGLAMGLMAGFTALWTLAFAYALTLGSLWAAWREVAALLVRLPLAATRTLLRAASGGAGAPLAPRLADYRFAAAAGAASPALPDSPPESPVLVDTGSFRVDRAKALEKLKGFQFRDAEGFLLPWVRCAVASGASRIRIERIDRGLRIRFNGDPITPATLKDPYEALFSEVGASGPARHLAVGLLAALRLAPAKIRIASGAGASRGCLNIGPADQDDRADGTGTDTDMEIRWSGFASLILIERCLAAASAGLGPSAPRVTLDGRLIEAGAPSGDGAVQVLEGTARGFVTRLRESARPGIRLYHLGALVEELPWPDKHHPFEARLENAAFKLDISQSGVVRDRVFDAAVALAVRKAEELEKSLAGDSGRPEYAIPGRLKSLFKNVVLLSMGTAAALALWPIGVDIPRGAHWVHLDHTPEVFVTWVGAVLFLTGFACVQFAVAAHRGSWFKNDWWPLVPLSPLLFWLLLCGSILPAFHGVAVGPGWIQLHYPWPLVRRLATIDIRAISVTDRQSIPPAENRWSVEFRTREGRRYKSSYADPGQITEAARTVSRASDTPIGWWRKDGAFGYLTPRAAP